MKSLKAGNNVLADAQAQIAIIEQESSDAFHLMPFQQKMELNGLYPLSPFQSEILQINIGKMCNQVCQHCHVDAGPDRKEMMTKETLQHCLEVLQQHPQLHTVDITGGAPEMHPDFRWFAAAIASMGRHVIVRCNLTIILANKKYHDLPDFYRKHKIEVVSSLPCYTQDNTDRQRGDGVFESSIKALQMLNKAGYGMPDTGLVLNLVYNPDGASLPPAQEALQKEYQIELERRFGIQFNNLFVITNMPINRYLSFLLNSGNYEVYMEKLVAAYNPAAAASVMCRNTISVSWDGYLYDCDFNQMLELKVNCNSQHISTFNSQILNSRSITIGQHCYGCTAGAGSSCGGAVA